MSMAGQQSEGRGIHNGAAQNGAAPVADSTRDQISVIGSDITITGNIEAEVDLHIEGRVIGDVRCATLILGEASSVQGSIYAQRVRVSGRVEGAVETRDLAIESGARVKGDVTYSRLRVANGGVIEGNMSHVAIEEETETSRLKLVQERQAKQEQPGKVHYFE